VAIRIDHIGSTSVPGLAAKPVIDIQISVARLEPAEPFLKPLERLGFIYRAGNTERTKRYFREPPGHARTHIHVRRAGSFSEQFPLLFRDYLRLHPAGAAKYERVKRRLAEQYLTTATSTPRRRSRSAGRSSGRPTSGHSRPDGNQPRPTCRPNRCAIMVGVPCLGPG
jgi:GrpB-like predicted nucleotidyltransferase (UPF0157 family)